jgi:hypothetical protein
MVWRIRSKTAFTFEKGTQRYITGKFKQINMNNMHENAAILVRTDRFSPTRITHNYRNISRACKQFLLGDPYAEQIAILLLRTEFLWPIEVIQSPLENYKPLYRIMADHTDRHYSLVSNNHHPLQLFLYESMNKTYRAEHANKLALGGTGPVTFEVAVKKRVE